MSLEYTVLLFVTLGIMRSLTTVFHELGHAIPTLIFTKGLVSIYIGSYGDPKKSLVLNIGRLRIFFKYDPLLWNHGLCEASEASSSIFKAIIIVLMGPLASLLLGSIALVILFSDFSEILRFISLMVAISSFLDFFHNITPNHEPITLYNGNQVNNDGRQLKELFRYLKVPKEFNTATDFYNAKDYEKAANLFQEILESGYQLDFIYRLAISSYLLIKKYEKASKINEEFYKKYSDQFDDVDYFNSGLMKSFMHDSPGSISDYSKSIELNPENANALNNRGYSYNLTGDYELAINDFDKAIKLEKNYAYALNNRGLAKVKLGKLEEGLKDLQRSFDIDDSNSYCHMNYGVYYFENGEYEKALEKFETAFEMDSSTYGLEDHLTAVREKLSL